MSNKSLFKKFSLQHCGCKVCLPSSGNYRNKAKRRGRKTERQTFNKLTAFETCQ